MSPFQILALILILLLSYHDFAQARSSMPPYSIRLGLGTEGGSSSQINDSGINNTRPAIEYQPTTFIMAGIDYWANPYLGLGLEYARLSEQNMTVEYKSQDSGGFTYFTTQHPGRVTQNRFSIGPFLRWGFAKNGAWAVIFHYMLTKGRVKLDYDSLIYASRSNEDGTQKGSRWGLGLEYMFNREAGLRLTFSQHKTTWQEITTVWLTKDPQFSFSQLHLEYIFRF